MIKLSPFKADITPPVGSPLCGGAVRPVAGVSEPLTARGIVLQGQDDPIVLCAVDWCEIRNADHDLWRAEIAAAVGATPERVAVQCIHQHNAPLADGAANAMIEAAPGGISVMDAEWCRSAVAYAARAAANSLEFAVDVTHIGTGHATVREIASNRRIMNTQGKVAHSRWSKSDDPEMRAAAEGTIDPLLRTVSFWNGGQHLASLHYYASHPSSYYGDGIVSCEFVGIAREQVERESGGAHIYFTGCAGDVTAGKYNTGTPEDRVRMTERLASAIREAASARVLIPLDRLEWRAAEVRLPENSARSIESLRAIAADAGQSAAARTSAAFEVAFKERLRAIPGISISCLALGESVRILHLPGEPFVDYQLAAQREAPEMFVAVAGYGDGGPGYIPLARSFDEGGYEPTGAFVGPESEAILKAAIRNLLST